MLSHQFIQDWHPTDPLLQDHVYIEESASFLDGDGHRTVADDDGLMVRLGG